MSVYREKVTTTVRQVFASRSSTLNYLFFPLIVSMKLLVVVSEMDLSDLRAQLEVTLNPELAFGHCCIAALHI